MPHLDPTPFRPTNAPFGPHKPICLDFGPAFLLMPFLLTLQHMYSYYDTDSCLACLAGIAGESKVTQKGPCKFNYCTYK